MSIPSRSIPTEPVRTGVERTILSKHCTHRIILPVPSRERFDEIIDWIDMGEGGCRGIYYCEPENYLSWRLNKSSWEIETRKDEGYPFVFQCSTTAMIVKMRWG